MIIFTLGLTLSLIFYCFYKQSQWGRWEVRFTLVLRYWDIMPWSLHAGNMRRNLARAGRLLAGFLMCYSLMIVRDLLSKSNQTSQDIFEDIMKERISRIEQFCRNKTVSADIKTGDNLYVLPHKKLLWCPVFKAASTNWMYNLLPLAGLDQNDINNIRFVFQWT